MKKLHSAKEIVHERTIFVAQMYKIRVFFTDMSTIKLKKSRFIALNMEKTRKNIVFLLRNEADV